MRKERVFIDENAHIQNLCCEVNLDGGIPKATISFDNLGYGVITAIKFCAQGFNAFNDIVLIEGKGRGTYGTASRFGHSQVGTERKPDMLCRWNGSDL